MFVNSIICYRDHFSNVAKNFNEAEMLTTHLSNNTQAAHPTPAPVIQQHQQHTHNAKLESLPRPKFTLNMTEAQWQFTTMQWEAYIAQTPASDAQLVQQLRAACDKDLLQRVYDCGTFDSLNTTALLITVIQIPTGGRDIMLVAEPDCFAFQRLCE